MGVGKGKGRAVAIKGRKSKPSPKTRTWRSAWFSELQGSRLGGQRASEARDLCGSPLAQGLLGSLYTQASGSPALCPGNQQAWSFIALSNRWAAGFLWVLIAYLAWHGMPAWFPGSLLPSLGNQTSSIAGSDSVATSLVPLA